MLSLTATTATAHKALLKAAFSYWLSEMPRNEIVKFGHEIDLASDAVRRGDKFFHGKYVSVERIRNRNRI